MANSRNSPRAEVSEVVASVHAALAAALVSHLSDGAKLAIALSGGIDSMVLLDAAYALAPEQRLALSAIHVHHGLSPNADRWATFCVEQCAARNIALSTHRLDLRRERGQSLEAHARKLRYERLLAADVDAIVLAHHADDQAETLLLQLLRGAGPAGLAAMPAFTPGRPALLRPLLGIPRATLAAYAQMRGLAWVDDESNIDRRHARNYLRSEIAPLFRARFAGYPETLVRAANHQAEATRLAEELAAIDAQGAIDASGLSRARLAELSPPRARNLLRWYLRREGLRSPSESRLREMLRQLVTSAEDARIRIVQDGAEIGRHRGRIAVHAPIGESFVRVWHGELQVSLPGGVLAFESTHGSGVSASKVRRASITLRSRTGGERIRLAANRPTHALKKLLQEADMPAWERQRLPLVWSGDELVAVPGIGVAVAFQAAPDEAGWRIEWRPRKAD